MFVKEFEVKMGIKLEIAEYEVQWLRHLCASDLLKEWQCERYLDELEERLPEGSSAELQYLAQARIKWLSVLAKNRLQERIAQ